MRAHARVTPPPWHLLCNPDIFFVILGFLGWVSREPPREPSREPLRGTAGKQVGVYREPGKGNSIVQAPADLSTPLYPQNSLPS